VSKKKKKKKLILEHPQDKGLREATIESLNEQENKVDIPIEKKKLYPRKLYPPPDVMRRMVEAEENKVEKNPLKRFFKKFFGEGY